MPTAQRNALTFLPTEQDRYIQFIAQAPDHSRVMDNGNILFRASLANIRTFNRLYPTERITDLDGTLARVSLSYSPITPQEHLVELQPDIKLFKHQERSIDTVILRDSFAFFHEMGTGKSAEMILGASELFLRGEINQALVMTTKRGLPQFLNEQIPTHIPTNVKHFPYQFKTIETAPRSSQRLHIAVVSHGFFQSPRVKRKNKSTVPSPKLQGLIDWVKRAPTALFIDECQNFKGWTGLRVNNLLDLSICAKKRFLYTGEPKPREVDDLYSQFYIMDPNILGHSTLTSFRNEFCETGGYTGFQVVSSKNEERLSELIAPHCEYVSLVSTQDMPSQNWEPPSAFEPTPQQLDLYSQARHDFLVTIAEGSYESDESKLCEKVATQLMTMQKIANGWFTTDNQTIIDITNERAEFTVEEKIGSAPKTIVWCRFHHDLEIMSRSLREHNIPFVEYSGRVPNRQMEPNKLRFQQDPACRVFLGTEASGGTSLNLQVANRMVWFSQTYNWGDFIQSWHRIWRTGQTKPCFFIQIAAFSVDHLFIKNHREKHMTSEMLRSLVDYKKIAEFI